MPKRKKPAANPVAKNLRRNRPQVIGNKRRKAKVKPFTDAEIRELLRQLA